MAHEWVLQEERHNKRGPLQSFAQNCLFNKVEDIGLETVGEIASPLHSTHSNSSALSIGASQITS